MVMTYKQAIIYFARVQMGKTSIFDASLYLSAIYGKTKERVFEDLSKERVRIMR